MNISLLNTPAMLIQTSPEIVSRWLATDSPSVFQLQRKDWLITASSESTGSPAGSMAFTLALAFTGSIGDSISVYNAYTGKMHTGKVTGFDGSDIETDISYSATFDGAYLNDSTLYNGFYFEGRLTINDKPQDLTAQVTPNSFGAADLDISGVLRLTPTLEKVGNYSTLVTAETNRSGKFTFAYRPCYQGSDEPYTEEGNIWNFAECVRSIEQGSNLSEFVPSDAGYAKLFNSFAQPVYFEGLPFDVSFLCPENVGPEITVTLTRYNAAHVVLGAQTEVINTAGLKGRLCSVNVDPAAIEFGAAYLTVQIDAVVGTWVPLSVPSVTGQLRGIHMVANTYGWAVGSDAVILFTRNGGSSWTEQTCPISIVLQDVFSINGINAWACGEISGPKGRILKSIDRGLTWTVKALSTSIDGPLKAIHFSDPNTGFACGSRTGTPLLLKSIDAGETWVRITIASTSTSVLDDLTGFGGSLWACGILNGDGAILKSTDAGETWTPLTLPDSYDHFYGIRFLDENTGWCVGVVSTHPVILKTTDGGTTWQEVYYSSESGTLSDVAFSDENNVVAVGTGQGDLGLVLTSSDGGNSWLKQDLTVPSAYLYGVALPGATAGYVVGYDPNSDEAIIILKRAL